MRRLDSVRYGFVLAIFLSATRAAAQGPPSCPGGVCVVSTEAQLADALSPGGAVFAASGDRIVFAGNITLTGDLPAVQIPGTITIDGAGFTLSGAGQYRGLVVGAMS